jgi:YfiH family protein
MKIYHSKLLTNFNNLIHGFTTKDEGNLAFHVEDNYLDVIKNHQLVASKFNYELENLIHMKQIHSSDVHIVNINDNFNNPPICDALITNKKNIPLMVMVADCTPILFYDKTKKVIAVAHTGREGTFKNIVKNVIDKFKIDYYSNVNDIIVCIGPSICQQCYEVNQEIYKNTIKLGLEYAIKKQGNKYYLNINKIIYNQLLECKINQKNIELSNECNSCNTKKYFSYRKDKKTGRFSGIIMLR